ncbi:MAG: thioredoxin family protein [Syntrophales bacterium]
MKIDSSKIIAGIFRLAVLLVVSASPGLLGAASPPEVPIKGMVTMIDLGAGECIPCKMMAPILVKMEKRYAGKAAVVFLDVWKDDAPARRFGIQTIPTQIFFDKKGKEVYRHVGFLSEEEIVSQFSKMGIK